MAQSRFPTMPGSLHQTDIARSRRVAPNAHVSEADSVGASIAIWNAKKGDDNAHAEPFGIFVGLWAPTFFAIANGLANDRSNG